MHTKSFKPGHRTTSLLSIIVLAVFAAIGVTACCDPNPPAPADYKIATRKIGTDGYIEKFTYDNNGKLSTEEKAGVIKTYTYSTPGIVKLTVSGQPYATFTLNSQGYIAADYFSPHMFTYDAEGHLIKKQPSTINALPTYSYTYDDNGNLTKEQFEFFGTTGLLVYDYYEEQDTRLDGSDWYYGKRSKNLVKEAKSNGKSIWHSSYDFDARGRVIREIKIFSNSGLQEVTTYTYFN